MAYKSLQDLASPSLSDSYYIVSISGFYLFLMPTKALHLLFLLPVRLPPESLTLTHFKHLPIRPSLTISLNDLSHKICLCFRLLLLSKQSPQHVVV